ncbi:hypothetical protein Tco_1237421 [Tanacetum coccineum]
MKISIEKSKNIKDKGRIEREKAEANIALKETWDDIQAKIETDQLLAERLQAREQEELTIEERAILFQQLLEKRRKHFATKRAKEKRNRQPTKAQQRSIMCTYLKNIEGWKPKDLKSRTELMEESSKKAKAEIAQESSSKRAGEALEQESFKKQKVEEDKESEELKNMLKKFNREDLEVLWSIVKARFKKTKPVNYMDNFLLLNLKTMFEHHVEDSVRKNQQGLVKVLNWKFYDSCGVHYMFNDVKLQVDYECEMAFKLFRLVKKQLKESYGRIVRIKRLLDDLEVTAAKILSSSTEGDDLGSGKLSSKVTLRYSSILIVSLLSTRLIIFGVDASMERIYGVMDWDLD